MLFLWLEQAPQLSWSVVNGHRFHGFVEQQQQQLLLMRLTGTQEDDLGGRNSSQWITFMMGEFDERVEGLLDILRVINSGSNRATATMAMQDIVRFLFGCGVHLSHSHPSVIKLLRGSLQSDSSNYSVAGSNTNQLQPTRGILACCTWPRSKQLRRQQHQLEQANAMAALRCLQALLCYQCPRAEAFVHQQLHEHNLNTNVASVAYFPFAQCLAELSNKEPDVTEAVQIERVSTD